MDRTAAARQSRYRRRQHENLMPVCIEVTLDMIERLINLRGDKWDRLDPARSEDPEAVAVAIEKFLTENLPPKNI